MASQTFSPESLRTRALAHDINNLLTAVSGFNELALGQLERGTPVCDDVERVGEAAASCATLVRQLIAGTEDVVEVSTADLNATLRSNEPLIRQLAGDDVAVSLDLEDGVVCVTAVPSELERLIVNLVVNAHDAMPDGGELSLGTGWDNGHAVLVIRDTGVGMNAKVRKRAFEANFTTKGNDGAGIGLSTVLQTIEHAGAHLTLVTAPGEGTTFTICFPPSRLQRAS
jgi:two-component system cell cycle sensor histidine kinase/response regulator CckA